MLKVLFAVVNRDGDFKRNEPRRCFHVYARRKTAERHATKDGDSVVELVWDTDREPLHITRRKLKEET